MTIQDQPHPFVSYSPKEAQHKFGDRALLEAWEKLPGTIERVRRRKPRNKFSIQKRLHSPVVTVSNPEKPNTLRIFKRILDGNLGAVP